MGTNTWPVYKPAFALYVLFFPFLDFSLRHMEPCKSWHALTLRLEPPVGGSAQLTDSLRSCSERIRFGGKDLAV